MTCHILLLLTNRLWYGVQEECEDLISLVLLEPPFHKLYKTTHSYLFGVFLMLIKRHLEAVVGKTVSFLVNGVLGCFFL